MLKSVLTAYDGLLIKNSFGPQCTCPGGAAAASAQVLSPVSSECGGGDREDQDGGATEAVADVDDRACEPSSNPGRLNHPPESRGHHPSEDQRQAEDDPQQQEDRIDDPHPDISSTICTAAPARPSNDGYGLIPEQDCGVPVRDNKIAHTARSRPPIAKPWSTSSKKKNRSTNNHKVTSSDGFQDSTFIKGGHFFSMSDEMIRGGAALAPGRDERSDDYFSSCTLSSSDAASDDRFDEDSHDSPSNSPDHEVASPLSITFLATSAAAGGDVSNGSASCSPIVRTLSPPKTPPIATKSHLSLNQAQRVTMHDTPVGGSPFSPAHSSCTNPSYISSSSSSSEGVLSDKALSEGDLIFSNDARAQTCTRPSNIDSGLVVANKEYNIHTEDTKEWLKLDSSSGDCRPMAVVLATVTALPPDEADLKINPKTRRLLSRLSSSSLSLSSKEDLERGVPSPKSFRGGLATLDTILMASSSLSVDTETDELVLDNDTNQNKATIASTGIGASTKNSKSEVTESLRSALKELDIDEEDSYEYTSTQSKGTKIPDTTTAADLCNATTNAVQGVDSKESEDRVANTAENSDESSLSLSSVDDGSFLSKQGGGKSHEAAPQQHSQNNSSVSPVETSPELLGTVIENQSSCERSADVAMVQGARDKTYANMEYGSLSDLSASMPPLDDSSVRHLTVRTFKVRSDSQDIVQAREQELRKKMCLAVTEIEEEYRERADVIRRQHEKKLQQLKRQLDLDLQRRAEYLRFGRVSRSIVPRINGLKGNCVGTGTGIKEVIAASKDVSNTKDSKGDDYLDEKGDPIVSETKKRKEAMEERLHNLLNRLHSPRGQEAAYAMDAREVKAPTEASRDQSGTETSPIDRETDAVGPFVEVARASEQKNYIAEVTSAIAKELYEERTMFQHLLINECTENENHLQQNCDEVEKEQVRAVEEVEALKEVLESQRRQFDEDFAQAEEVSKRQVDYMEDKLQHVKGTTEASRSDLCDEIEDKENAISVLTSKLEEMRVCNDSLEEKLELQATDMASVKAESNAFQARVAKLTKTVREQAKVKQDELKNEVDKLGVACNQVRQEVSAAIDRQYSEGNRKKVALEDEQNKVTERMGALKKLLLIKEASTASMVEDWSTKETNLLGKSQQLAEAITFAEEKRTNKTAAFTRVVAQLNNSYDVLSATIDETRQQTDRILKQRREVNTEISSLSTDNKQIEDWVNALGAVIDTLEKGEQ